MLLVIALEALLGLSTYGEPEQCDACGQTKYKITATISDNVSLVLMDTDDTIKRRIKKLYGARSKFVHNGREIDKAIQQEMQEYVRKVLLMYWCVSMYKSTQEHKKIIEEVQSPVYQRCRLQRRQLLPCHGFLPEWRSAFPRRHHPQTASAVGFP